MMRARRIASVVGLILALTGMAQAVTLEGEGLVFETFNWEHNTMYTGEAGTYFRNEDAFYHRQDGTKIEYDSTIHGLISDLTISRDPSLLDGEDAWGLLEIRVMNVATVGPIGSPWYPMIMPEDAYWKRGDGGEYLLGQFWGVEDQAVIIDGDGNFRVYANDLQFAIHTMNSFPGNPHVEGPGRPKPEDRIDHDTTANWNENPGQLVMAGESTWYRFNGTIELNDDGDLIDLDGARAIHMNVTSGAWDLAIPPYWPTPGQIELSDVEQLWGLDNYNSRWLDSKDTGRAATGSEERQRDIVPEPATVVFAALGLAGLVGRRKRRRR